MGTHNTFQVTPLFTETFPSDGNVAPLMLRTSLVERIIAASGGSRELLPITLIPNFLPISYQTIRNQIAGGKNVIGAGTGSQGLEVVRFNSRVFVRTEDLLRLIWNSKPGVVRKKTGRKSNRERASALTTV